MKIYHSMLYHKRKFGIDFWGCDLYRFWMKSQKQAFSWCPNKSLSKCEWISEIVPQGVIPSNVDLQGPIKLWIYIASDLILCLPSCFPYFHFFCIGILLATSSLLCFHITATYFDFYVSELPSCLDAWKYFCKFSEQFYVVFFFWCYLCQ